MTPEQLLAAALAQRETLVRLTETKAVTIRRPPEIAIPRMLKKSGDQTQLHAGLDEVKTQVVGWVGFAESDFLAGGSSDAVIFDTRLWAVWIEDHRDHIGTVAQAIVDAVISHEQRTAQAQKN